MTNTEIQFGNYAAEPRTDGYYLRHSNGGGAMATLVEVALIKKLIEVREQWDAAKAVWEKTERNLCKSNRGRILYLQSIADALPATWYADAPLEDRVKLLVDQWQKLHLREQQVADALAELRESFVVDARLKPDYECGWNDGIQRAIDLLAALALPEPMATNQWAAEREWEVADALATLRAYLAETVASPQNFSVPALQKAINHDLDNTIISLGLPEPTAKEK